MAGPRLFSNRGCRGDGHGWQACHPGGYWYPAIREPGGPRATSAREMPGLLSKLTKPGGTARSFFSARDAWVCVRPNLAERRALLARNAWVCVWAAPGGTPRSSSARDAWVPPCVSARVSARQCVWRMGCVKQL